MLEKPLIKVYDSSLTLLGIVDDYELCRYERSYYGAGQFAITINYNLPNAQLFQKDRILQFGDNTRNNGIITKRIDNIGESGNSQTGRGSQTVDISGYESKYIAIRRIIRDINDVDAYVLSGTGETVIKTLISSQMGPACTDPNRVIDNLTIEADSARGDDYSLSAKYSNVYTEAVAAATNSGVGWYFDLDLDAKTFVLKCEEGADRSATCIFSPDFDSLKKGKFTDDSSRYKNLVYVGGSGSGTDRVIVTGFDTAEPTGFGRVEAFNSASSLGTEDELNTRAASLLTQYLQTYTLTGDVLASSPFVLDNQYFVGDIVTVRFNNIDVPVRVLDVSETWRFGKYDISITWGRPAADISDQMATIISGATNTGATTEAGTNSSGMRNGVTTYNMSASDAVMLGNECINNIIELTGAPSANRNLTLYLDTDRLYGRKAYTVIASCTGNKIVTVKTAQVGTTTVSIPSGVRRVISLFVDDSGNVTEGSDALIISIDGGAASTVYGIDQIIDGGAA